MSVKITEFVKTFRYQDCTVDEAIQQARARGWVIYERVGEGAALMHPDLNGTVLAIESSP